VRALYKAQTLSTEIHSVPTDTTRVLTAHVVIDDSHHHAICTDHQNRVQHCYYSGPLTYELTQFVPEGWS
jgi:hypothetical protein